MTAKIFVLAGRSIHDVLAIKRTYHAPIFGQRAAIDECGEALARWFSGHSFRKIDSNLGSHKVIQQFGTLIIGGREMIMQCFPKYDGLRDLLIQYAEAYAALKVAAGVRQAEDHFRTVESACHSAVSSRHYDEEKRQRLSGY